MFIVIVYRVIEKLNSKEKEVITTGDIWYKVRITPKLILKLF